jgi:hypothetical protein
METRTEGFDDLRLLTVEQVRDLFAFRSRAAVAALVKGGQLTPVKGFGRFVRFRYTDVARLIAGDGSQQL